MEMETTTEIWKEITIRDRAGYRAAERNTDVVRAHIHSTDGEKTTDARGLYFIR